MQPSKRELCNDRHDGDPATTRIAVLFRPPGGGRWKKLATVRTSAEAVAMIDRAGDWWLHDLDLEVEDDGPGLFAEET